MIGDDDRMEILESFLVGDDPNLADARWADLLTGDDLFWISTMGIDNLLRDPTHTSWIQLLASAIKQALPQLDPSALEQDLAALIPQLCEMEIVEPDMRWYWLMAELQEKYNTPPDEGPKRRWPAPDDPASLVVLAVHEAMAATSSPEVFRQRVELLLPTYAWLETALRYHRLNYSIHATRDQRFGGLATHLSSLSEFARRRAIRIESARQQRPYYGSPEIAGSRVRCVFCLPLSNEDTWQLMLEDRSLGSIHLRREPTGNVTVLEASGAWPDCVPAERCWIIRRAAESVPPAKPAARSRGAPQIVPEPNEDDVKLTIIWPPRGDQNG